MAYFSKSSEERIATLHPDLQRVLRKAINVVDFSVIDGLRNEESQKKAVANKRSKVNFPNSRHNRSKRDDGTYDYKVADAVDVAPYPIQWPNINKQTAREYVRRMGRFYLLAGVIKACAIIEQVELKWGGEFKNFFDGPHFQRVVK